MSEDQSKKKKRLSASGEIYYGTHQQQQQQHHPPDEHDDVETAETHRRHRSWSLHHDTTPIVGNTHGSRNVEVTSPLLQSRQQQKQKYTKHSSLPLSESAASSSVGSASENKRGIMERLRSQRATRQQQQQPTAGGGRGRAKGGLFYYVIYAIVNVIISLPGLYGYAAVIFNHPVFNNHMNALSKLVIFSSLMHQLGFLLFSTLPFAIGTVQDAGLIFLSSMSNKIAKTILHEGGSEQAVLSTVLVLLSLGTACLGLVLIVMGRLNLANAVSYLPMPVVGGYLAFIGYFCLMAGTGLCISKSMMTVLDWRYLVEYNLLILAIPGLLAGLLLTYISRSVENDAALPLVMCLIPAAFYIIIYVTGLHIEGAREYGWVGQVSPPVPVSDLLGLVDFSLVRWDLILEILATWTGMVFVVSFASCLDVAAISMDMGEALDTNKELATVGICNFMSGLTFGFTGSYIFSQTIFTYRTGVHSRWIGVLIMCVFLYVVVSPMNILQVAPLFFLGSTLIFIGYDLLYEWLVEIRHKIFLSEYAIVWATFVSIQIVGIDAGIILGVLVSIVEHAILSAQTTAVKRVSKQSRAVWTPSDYKLLHEHGYNASSPKILTLEIIGTVFFGSSLQLLERLTQEIGLDLDEEVQEETDKEMLMRSPHQPARLLMGGVQRRRSMSIDKVPLLQRRPPKFIVLDLTQMSNLDASASRTCFLQLAKLCAKKRMVVCAAGPSPRVNWMLRSHDVAYSLEQEDRVKAQLQASRLHTTSPTLFGPDTIVEAKCERVLLFLTLHEALEFSESALIRDLTANKLDKKTPSFTRLDQYGATAFAPSISHVVSHILGLSDQEREIVEALEGERYHTELTYHAGTVVYAEGTHADAFYVVLQGTVAAARTEDDDGGILDSNRRKGILSGAGPVRSDLTSSSKLLGDPTVLDISRLTSFYPVGGIFGFVDFLLERPRRVKTVASQDSTVVAKFTRSQMALLRAENQPLDAMLQRVLLQAAVLDLANCTCSCVD